MTVSCCCRCVVNNVNNKKLYWSLCVLDAFPVGWMRMVFFFHFLTNPIQDEFLVTMKSSQQQCMKQPWRNLMLDQNRIMSDLNDNFSGTARRRQSRLRNLPSYSTSSLSPKTSLHVRTSTMERSRTRRRLVLPICALFLTLQFQFSIVENTVNGFLNGVTRILLEAQLTVWIIRLCTWPGFRSFLFGLYGIKRRVNCYGHYGQRTLRAVLAYIGNHFPTCRWLHTHIILRYLTKVSRVNFAGL